MAVADKDFFADYETEGLEDINPDGNFLDADGEYFLEPKCCVTGEAVKTSFCRFPDPELGTMMVMSRESMLKYSRNNLSLSEKFEQVLEFRRKHESKKK